MAKYFIQFGLFVSLCVFGQTSMKVPSASKKIHSETRHGIKVDDPWHWIKEKTNPAVIQYLNDENTYAALKTEDIKGFSNSLYEEMLSKIKQTDMQVPYKKGDYFYFSRTLEGQQYPILCRKKIGTDLEQIYMDLNEMAKGHKFFSIGMLELDKSQSVVAYAVDTTGFRQYKLFFKDINTGKTLGFTEDRVTSLSWLPDSKGVLFTTEDEVTKRSNKLWTRELEGSSSHLLYEEKNEAFNISLSETSDDRFIVLVAGSTDTYENWIIDPLNSKLELQSIAGRTKGHKYSVDHGNDQYFIRTNQDAKNFKVVTTLTPQNPSTWVPFIPHDLDIYLESLALFKGFGVLSYRQNAQDFIKIYNFTSQQWTPIVFKESVFVLSGATNAEYETPSFRFSYQSMITPSTLYEYDFQTKNQVVLKQQEVLGGYSPLSYVTERVWATARDGVQIPITLLYKKGTLKNAKSPLFLYGYGSYGISMDPSFSSSRISLVDRGMIYAIAHIRGGGELGEPWHDSGMLLTKMNTFYDFIDSAEWLVDQKYADRKRIVIEGGSAGGLLMGAVTNLKPDLWKAVHAAVPFVDVMNTMWDETLPLTVGEFTEWGNPKEKKYYDYMFSYSPYDNLRNGKYPSMLVTTSLNDSQVMYWEPAKYVAKLRSLNSDRNLLVFKCNMDAGHGGASGRYDALKERAFEWAWLMNQVGINK